MRCGRRNPFRKTKENKKQCVDKVLLFLSAEIKKLQLELRKQKNTAQIDMWQNK